MDTTATQGRERLRSIEEPLPGFGPQAPLLALTDACGMPLRLHAAQVPATGGVWFVTDEEWTGDGDECRSSSKPLIVLDRDGAIAVRDALSGWLDRT